MQLNMTIAKIGEILGITVDHLDIQKNIHAIRSLEHATNDDIAFILDRGDASVFESVSLQKIQQCQAGIIISHEKVIDGKPYLIVKDPLEAFQKIVDVQEQHASTINDFQAHPHNILISSSAHVDPTARIEPGAVICAHAVIKEHAIIESHTFIGQHCTIGAKTHIHAGVRILSHCSIGNNCIIHANTVIGSDGFGYQVTKQGLRKIPQVGIVSIGHMTEIGALCAIDRASFEVTKIGNGVKIDNAVHIAHNVTIEDGCAILAQTGIAGSAHIGMGCQIGGQVAIKNDITIGKGTKVVSKSGVMQNLKDGSTVCGIPAIDFSLWKRIHAISLRLPEWSKLVASLKEITSYKKQSLWQKIKFFLGK